MTSADLAAARRVLGETDDQLAASLNVTPHVVRAWTNGTARIPRAMGQRIRWLVASAERGAALERSGLPECTWLREHRTPPQSDELEPLLAHAKAIDEHRTDCGVCQARDRFVAEHFGPMPPYPFADWTGAFSWIERLPPWARPAAVGAVLLAALVLVHMVLSLPKLFASPGLLGAAGVTLLAAAAAGALGGLWYSLTRPLFRRLGRPGNYLTGIACAVAYMGGIAVLGPFVFGEPLLKDRADWIAFLAITVLFGLVVGHSMEPPSDGR